MAQQKSKNEMNATQKASIGFGLTAAAVTAAGAYFLYGSNKAAQNRKKVKGWMLKAKGEILETLENAQTLTEDEYKALVEAATGAYGTVKNASVGEMKEFKKEMAEHWQKIQKTKVVKKLTAGQKVEKKAVTKTPAKKVVEKAPTKKVEVKPVAKKVVAKGGK
jgi:hypothetical protein